MQGRAQKRGTEGEVHSNSCKTGVPSHTLQTHCVVTTGSKGALAQACGELLGDMP